LLLRLSMLAWLASRRFFRSRFSLEFSEATSSFVLKLLFKIPVFAGYTMGLKETEDGDFSTYDSHVSSERSKDVSMLSFNSCCDFIVNSCLPDNVDDSHDYAPVPLSGNCDYCCFITERTC